MYPINSLCIAAAQCIPSLNSIDLRATRNSACGLGDSFSGAHEEQVSCSGIKHQAQSIMESEWSRQGRRQRKVEWLAICKARQLSTALRLRILLEPLSLDETGNRGQPV